MASESTSMHMYDPFRKVWQWFSELFRRSITTFKIVAIISQGLMEQGLFALKQYSTLFDYLFLYPQ